MKIKVYCKNHNGARVRLLEGTVAYWYEVDGKNVFVRETEEAANMIHLDEANFFCEGDPLKAAHEFGYYITV
jgi:hypothetical protein